MADECDADSECNGISETDHETRQTCSNNSSIIQKNNECEFTNNSRNLTRSYTSSLQSDVPVQNSTSIQSLDLKSHVDYSESNYKNSDLSGHINSGNLENTSKSASDSVGLKVDKKDQPQSIKDIGDSNVTIDSEKDRQIPVTTFKGDTSLQGHSKGRHNVKRNTNTRNGREVTIRFNSIRQGDLSVPKQEAVERIGEETNRSVDLWQIPPDTSQLKSTDDHNTLEYKGVKLINRGYPLQSGTLPSGDCYYGNDSHTRLDVIVAELNSLVSSLVAGKYIVRCFSL